MHRKRIGEQRPPSTGLTASYVGVQLRAVETEGIQARTLPQCELEVRMSIPQRDRNYESVAANSTAGAELGRRRCQDITDSLEKILKSLCRNRKFG